MLRKATCAGQRRKATPPSRGKECTISTKIFVGNLSFRTTEEQLATTLGAAGQVKHVHIGTDRETGRSRGFAFVEFETEAEAADAIRRFDGQEVDGRKLRVNTAVDRPRSPHGPRPGGDARPRASRPPDGPSIPQESWDAFGGGGGGPFADRGRPLRNKGSRRGLRARKRSLNF